MEIINVVQGSKEWHDLRAKHFTASEAPAMAGVSKYMSRNDLLKQKKTGIVPDVTDQQQLIFDRGHASEAAARPIAERIIDEELYPVTGVSEEHSKLLASLDGQTMLGDIIWEHKQINDVLRGCTGADDLPEMYKVQMDQQLLVSGADKCLFMASNGTEEDMVYFWYESTEERFKAILEGWTVFATDLMTYEPVSDSVSVVGTAPDSLPALNIKLTGAVSASNLKDFKATAVARIDAIKTDLQTDEDFADAEQTVKFLKTGEKQLQDAKKQALAETASIEELFRTVDDLSEMMRQKRLTLEKLVKAEKENKKLAIIQGAHAEFNQWLSEQDSPVNMSRYVCDPASAMKGKKTIKSLQSAADDAVAAAKVQAKQEIDRIKNNAAGFNIMAEGYEFLFADRDLLLVKQGDDLTAVIQSRIAEHKQREAEAKAKEKAEAEAKAKAEREAVEQSQAAEQRAIEIESYYAEDDSGLETVKPIQAKFPCPEPARISGNCPDLGADITQWANSYGIQSDAVTALIGLLSKNGIKL